MAKKIQRGMGSLNPLEDLLTDNMVETKGAVSTLRLSEIEPRADQPRKEFSAEALTQLADSIAAHGVLQPILVRPGRVGEGYYEIIAGERRWRAAKMAGLTEVPVIVMDSDELHAAEIALIEDVQRADLNPVEEAFGYRRLMDEFGLTQEQVASQVGKSRPASANALRRLDLPALELLRSGEITAGHARALLGLRDRSEIDPLAEKIAEQEMSVRAAEEAVRRINARPVEEEVEETPATDVVVDYFAELERKTMSMLGRKVKIAHSPRKRVLELCYEDNEDLEQLLIRLCGSEIFEEL